ncbi:MAG: FAD-dependent oxidoreductase [Bacteroidales bacterium]|nr:FAD-dependent oxidoreductase [Bacteroidales bacterium]
MNRLKNNFIMPPLKLGYCEKEKPGFVNERHLNFYNRVGKHLGALIPEPLYMDLSLREIPTQLGIDNDDKIAGLKKLTDAMHSHGTKVIAHLNHPGRMANPMIPGNVFISSTDKPCETGGKTPRKMTETDMQNVIAMFKDRAKRAEEAGFDFIELQSGHGYLLAQFISPQVNDRTDAYGGSFENRLRFPLQVIDAVQNVVNIPIIVRISGDEMTPDGIHLEEMILYAEILKSRAVAALHVSAGTVCSTPPWYFQHMFVPKGKTWEFAYKIKSEVEMPVIFVGQINTFEDINKIKTEYEGNYIAVGRALVADPDFIGKYLGEVQDEYRPCLACAEGCLGGVKSGKGLACMVNPEVSNPDLISFGKPKKIKNIAIVGGGLAGMETALRLNEKGHKVTIFEKDKLGGQFNLAWLPPNKASLKKILDYYFEELKIQNIPVDYKEAYAAELSSGVFDEVIIATGAEPVTPPIKGLETYFWTEFLDDANLPKNKKIVIIGGGLIGVETASKLTDADNEVIIVEMFDEIARGMEMIERKMTLGKLNKKGVKIYKNYKVIEVKNDGKTVIIEGEQTIELTGINHIVVTTGMHSVNKLAEELKGKIKTHLIGDAVKPAKAQDAISSAYHLAALI